MALVQISYILGLPQHHKTDRHVHFVALNICIKKAKPIPKNGDDFLRTAIPRQAETNTTNYISDT